MKKLSSSSESESKCKCKDIRRSKEFIEWVRDLDRRFNAFDKKCREDREALYRKWQKEDSICIIL